MPPAHDLPHFVHALLNPRGGCGPHHDAQRVLPRAVLFLIRGQRDDNPIVLRASERRAQLLSDAHDLAGNIVPFDFFFKWVHSRQEIFHEVPADYADGSGASEIGVRDVPSADEINVVEPRHLGGPRAQIGVFHGIQAGFGLHAASERGTDLLASLAKIANGLVIVPEDLLAFLELHEVVHVGHDGWLLGQAENIRAEVEDFGGHVLVRAVDQADHGDHGGDADDHAEQREDAAQLVRPETRGGDLYGLGEIHRGAACHVL